MQTQRICLFPGTFDPVTLGHIDIINRSLPLFDKVIVGIGINAAKNPMFSADQRKQWFEEIYKEHVSKPAFKELDIFSVEETHNGYFSQDSKGKVKDTSGETKSDDDTYSLIMKDKEKLLQKGKELD